MIDFKLESAEHRRIVFDRNAKFPDVWRDFRSFLLSVGPCPGEHYRLAATLGERAYGDDSRWEHKGAKRPAAPPPPPSPETTYSQWTMISGQPVEVAKLSTSLGVPFSSIAAALNAGRQPDELVKQSDVASALLGDINWFSAEPQHQDAFRQAFRAWHMKVNPRFAEMATPKFLYLYILLPDMIRCKTALADTDLWDPPTEWQKRLRDASPIWKRYCELFPKAQLAAQEFKTYRQYSLTSQLEDLWTRIQSTEARFRGAQSHSTAQPVEAASG
ncbi:hypothetical protein [Caulobacter sp. S45]|uniref:hypothetical protein n=1 Tax=Caulobacter sp. S45 TaxID=1641861 RepID=UPI00131CFE5C|nr:hypothetical protein [Caulobacter sp. S45]